MQPLCVFFFYLHLTLSLSLFSFSFFPFFLSFSLPCSITWQELFVKTEQVQDSSPGGTLRMEEGSPGGQAGTPCVYRKDPPLQTSRGSHTNPKPIPFLTEHLEYLHHWYYDYEVPPYFLTSLMHLEKQWQKCMNRSIGGSKQKRGNPTQEDKRSTLMQANAGARVQCETEHQQRICSVKKEKIYI